MPYDKIPCPRCDGTMAWNSTICGNCWATRGTDLNLIGQRFGLLLVIESSSKHQMGIGEPSWICQCDCGNIIDKRGCDLRKRGQMSCGCEQLNKFTHGQSRTVEYNTWLKMNERCNNPNNKNWPNYGGRGIIVCKRWKDIPEGLQNFIIDMGRRPEKMTLERIDNNGPYSPENCRWATRKEQSVNTRRTKFITYNGETLAMKDWAVRSGIPYNTVFYRITKAGWSVEKALTTPVGVTFGPRKR